MKMIKLTEPLIDITMKIEMDLPQTQMIEFLKKQGYKIEGFRQYLLPTEEMLVSENENIKYTFVALKDGQTPSDDNLYLKVFEKEIKKLLMNI